MCRVSQTWGRPACTPPAPPASVPADSTLRSRLPLALAEAPSASVRGGGTCQEPMLREAAPGQRRVAQLPRLLRLKGCTLYAISRGSPAGPSPSCPRRSPARDSGLLPFPLGAACRKPSLRHHARKINSLTQLPTLPGRTLTCFGEKKEKNNIASCSLSAADLTVFVRTATLAVVY